jgi:hypothetical protein
MLRQRAPRTMDLSFQDRNGGETNLQADMITDVQLLSNTYGRTTIMITKMGA